MSYERNKFINTERTQVKHDSDVYSEALCPRREQGTYYYYYYAVTCVGTGRRLDGTVRD